MAVRRSERHGPATAADLASLNQLLSTPNTGLCAILKMNNNCPQLPTVTQGILEVAALANSPPEIVARAKQYRPGMQRYRRQSGCGTQPITHRRNTILATFPLNSPPRPHVGAVVDPDAARLRFAEVGNGAWRPSSTTPRQTRFLYAVGVSSMGVINAERAHQRRHGLFLLRRPVPGCPVLHQGPNCRQILVPVDGIKQ